jgi:hypothetical protein
MTTVLNIKTCANDKGGRLHFEAISIYQDGIQFSKRAVKLMDIKEGDRVIFELKDGVLRVKFDSKMGFNIKRMTINSGVYMVIHNTKLARSLEKIGGKKMIVGEFCDGGYELVKYK